MVFVADKSINGVTFKKGASADNFSKEQVETMKSRGWLTAKSEKKQTQTKEEGK